MLQLIKVKPFEVDLPEDCLLYQKGKLDLKTGKLEKIKFEMPIPLHSALFQLNRKLYVCGGFTLIESKLESLSTHFTLDFEGKSEVLQSMEFKRGYLSLSGVIPQLIAIGGMDKEYGVYTSNVLNVCEMYSITLNKWTRLPGLNLARCLPGTILLESKKAFCFCGRQEGYTNLNSIETLQTDSGREWAILALTDRVAPGFYLACA